MGELGKLTSWDDARGFGFITSLQGNKRLFVHISAFPQGRRPVGEEMLRYIPGTDDRGRLQALRVEFLVEVTEPAHFRWTLATWGALIFVALFLMALLATVFVGKLPFYIPLVSILLSSILFTEYQHDKKAAQASRWRTAENRLHLLSLLGGWPGALVAQQGLRHKSRKTAFLVPFWITVILNIAALGIFSNVFSALQSPARVSGYEHFRSSH